MPAPDSEHMAAFSAMLVQVGVPRFTSESTGGLSFTVTQDRLKAFLAAFTEDAVKAA